LGYLGVILAGTLGKVNRIPARKGEKNPPRPSPYQAVNWYGAHLRGKKINIPPCFYAYDLYI
jgi:hypothetical protein